MLKNLYRTFCLCLALRVLVEGFPLTQLKTYTSGLDPNAVYLLDSHINIEGSDIMLYLETLAVNHSAFYMHKINASTSPPSFLCTFTKTFIGLIKAPQVVIMNNKISFAYTDSTGNWGVWIHKSNMTAASGNLGTNGNIAGIYLKNIQTVIMHGTNEYAMICPEGGCTQLYSGYYASGSSNPILTKSFTTKDESKMFTFYPDTNFFLMRAVTTGANMKNDFVNPTKIIVSETGYQCSCLSDDDTELFVLLPSNVLKIYDVSSLTVKSSVATPYTNVTKCYHDAVTSSLTLVAETYSTPNSGSSAFYLFSLESFSTLSSSTLSALYLTVDRVNNVATMSTSTEILLYQVIKYCHSNEYYDLSSDGCFPCPTGCLTCESATNCTTCVTDYTLDANNMCLVNTTSSNVDNATNSENERRAFIKDMLSYVINNKALMGLNRVPGGRKALPFLCFFINLDQLWLYQYHEADYGETMVFFFNAMQVIENQKWQLIGEDKTDKIYEFLGTSRKQIAKEIDTKAAYSHTGFYQAQGKGETFLPACWEFLTFNIFFVLICYFLLRLGFKMLFHYRISIFLRAFSFLAYLMPLLLDGNLQYFCFLMFAQSDLSFSLSPKDKAYTALGALLYFIVLLFSIVMCFFSYCCSRKLTKYILDNWRTRIFGLLSFSFGNSLRMLIFGAIHSLLRFDVSLQLLSLLVAECAYIFLMFWVMKYWRVHKVQFKAWFSILFAFLRIILQAVLYTRQQLNEVQTDTKIYYLFQDILAFILLVYMITFYAGTFTEIINEIIDVCKPSKQAPEPIKQIQPTKQQKSILVLKATKQKKNKKVSIDNRVIKFQEQTDSQGRKILIKSKPLKGALRWMIVQEILKIEQK